MPPSPTSPTPSILPATSGSSPSTPTASGNGLVRAVHEKCDVGDKILQYLASGDNQGDPQLDILFASDVGASLPRARSLASQYIQQCDARLFQQEAQQESAQASTSAKASRAAAEAHASALAEQEKAARLTIKKQACAAIGGTVRESQSLEDLCVSATPDRASDGSGPSCSYAQIAFQPDGTLSSKDISDVKGWYPGCFG